MARKPPPKGLEEGLKPDASSAARRGRRGLYSPAGWLAGGETLNSHLWSESTLTVEVYFPEAERNHVDDYLSSDSQGDL